MTQRAWFVAFLLVAGACTHGTSGWVLSQDAPSSGGASGGPDAGLLADASDAAPDVHEAGAAGAAGASDAPAPRCPTRFESLCSPAIVLDNRDMTASGALFAQAIPDLATTLPCITRDVCDTLYRKVSEIRTLTKITVIIEDYAGISETWSTGTEATIHMSSRHMQQVTDANGNLSDELLGIFYYHGANIYQLDGGNGTTNAWLVEGVADFVRHAGGYLPDDQRKAGGKYNDGYATTAFFFVWLDSQYPDFVYELNLSLTPNAAVPWTTQAFADITGKSVDALWTSYQASF
ncbi:MAG TPA: basic secretory protein-like protein [Polyangiaceae bacterium]|nr:basic secretory protein-like protein [Polyangiaceae bacterium]